MQAVVPLRLMYFTWSIALDTCMNVRLANAGRVLGCYIISKVGQMTGRSFMQGTCNFTLQPRSEVFIRQRVSPLAKSPTHHLSAQRAPPTKLQRSQSVASKCWSNASRDSMVVFTKRPKERESTASVPAPTATSPSLKPMRWSDIAAGRGSTLPDEVTFQAIMDTTELCEHVFFHLPTTDLYRAKRVCRRLKSVINESPQLQENLFLKPRKGRTTWATPDTDGTFTLLTGSRAAQPIAISHINGKPTSAVDILELQARSLARPILSIARVVTSMTGSTSTMPSTGRGTEAIGSMLRCG